MQPINRLWLKATYYGNDVAAVRVGMTGRFVPADGTAAIPIRVQAIFNTSSSGGGSSVAMTPIRSRAALRSGVTGRVSLDVPQRQLLAVPTRALILDQGKWWVLLSTAQGNRPQQVVPGASEGWDTLIEQGLHAGDQVVVNNAYLLFHQSIAQTYQLPG